MIDGQSWNTIYVPGFTLTSDSQDKNRIDLLEVSIARYISVSAATNDQFSLPRVCWAPYAWVG